MAKDQSEDEERRIYFELMDFLSQEAKLFHWSNAKVLKRLNLKYPNISREDLTYVDMYDVFTTEPIVVYGALDFKLKHVAVAFHSLGLIDTTWPSSSEENKEETTEDKNTEDKNTKIMKSIETYNEIDYKVIYEITHVLRKSSDGES